MSHILLPELTAMQVVADAVSPLSPSERRRVAAWLLEYASEEQEWMTGSDTDIAFSDAPMFVPEANEEEVAAAEVAPQGDESYGNFNELIAAVAPKTGAQKVAVAGWWLQTKEGHESWKASETNKLLKSAGIRLSSISIVLTNGVKAANPLMEELERLGDSERSRKTFRLTDAGVAFVESRLA